MSGDIVELRVHGVSGAEAGQVLDRPHVRQVAGDRSAGFYRPRPGYPGTVGPGGVVPEAYRWSDLPSGTATRTLSLVFLLPFMLSNVAIWMRPSGRVSGSGVKVLCRLLALNLTLLYVLSAAGVALDLIAWKCMGSSRCLAGRSWLSWLADRPVELRVVVLAVVPAAAVGLVWLLSAHPGHAYEAFRVPTGTGREGGQLKVVGQLDPMPMAGRLRAIHVGAALAVLDLVLLAARGATGFSPVTTALVTVAAAVLVACAALLCAPALLERESTTRKTDRVTSALRAVACGLTVAALGTVVLDRTPWPQSHGLPGYHLLVAWVFLAQMALLVALGVLVLWRRGGRDRGPALLRGLGAPVIGAVAVGLANALSAELVYQMAYFLDRRPLTERLGELAAPPPYKWAILSFFLTAMSALMAGGGMTLLSRRGRRRTAAAIVTRDFPAAPPDAARQVRRVEKAITRARFTEQLGPLAIAYACLAPIGLAASLLGVMNLEPNPLAERLLGLPSRFMTFVMAGGSYLIAGVVVALVLGGLFAYRTAGFRRYVGVLWDLGTFWPPAAHPFAPPYYAERAVPELANRICYLTEHHAGVLLTGHSHGSVLLAATVLRLPPQVSDRVALLTYGSPLNRLYARLFPAYLGEDVLREVGDRIGWRWVNLWRDTDPIGGWIFSGHRPGDPPVAAGPAGSVDRRLRDPQDVVAPQGDSVPPPIAGHWPCESDERFAAAVRELVDRLRDSDRS